jgi:hypothetical protein
MTTPAPRTCSTPDCRREAEPNYTACSAHIVARLTGAFGEPEWVRRMRVRGLPAKDFTAAA